MKKFQKDILYYAHCTLSVFIVLQLWVCYDTNLEIQKQYQTIDRKADSLVVHSLELSEINSFQAKVKKSLTFRNLVTKPFLELIQERNGRDLETFSDELEFAFLQLTDNNMNEFEPKEKRLLQLMTKYPGLEHYVTQQINYLAQIMLTSSNRYSCCFCQDEIYPFIKEINNELHIYPNYKLDSPKFEIVKVNGEECKEGIYRWTPTETGFYNFNVDYSFLTDRGELKSITKNFVLTVK